jgi:hypothetical protein
MGIKYIDNPDEGSLGEALDALVDAINAQDTSTFTLVSANGAISPHVSGGYVITKGSIAALTLAAPTAGTDDGVRIEITSNTAFAHTVTATGLFLTGTASVNLATFAAFAGARLSLRAYNGKWFASGTGITFS